MSSIRPLEKDDHPWADPELPSLVSTSQAFLDWLFAEVAAALALGQALLTRMNGTWWMGHLVEPFTSSKAPSPR
jgi:hypothetical protein